VKARKRVLALSVCVSAALALSAAMTSAAVAAAYVLRVKPTVSLFWYPLTPHVGEDVTLISTSSDLASAITGWAWDVSDNGTFGPFVAGGPSVVARFSTPAPHAVRLRVTAADGESNVGSATIRMSSARGVITPFPIVRIVGRDTRHGVRLRLLAVRAPRRSVIKVRCGGSGCPASVRGRAYGAAGRGGAWVRFTRFARAFKPGARLEVKVSRGSEIGAYTSFTVRRRGLPLRRDSCLNPARRTPMACPAA
jgi:hypothetical protein